jgi:hypothetical protein
MDEAAPAVPDPASAKRQGRGAQPAELHVGDAKIDRDPSRDGGAFFTKTLPCWRKISSVRRLWKPDSTCTGSSEPVAA